MLSTVELFLLLFLLSWLLQWTADLLVLFFVGIASRRLRSALASALDSAKCIRCKGQAALSFPSSVAKKKMSSQRHVMHVVSDILPGHDLKLTFLSATQIYIPNHDRHIHTYIHCENRSLIQSLVLMRLAITIVPSYTGKYHEFFCRLYCYECIADAAHVTCST